MRELVLVGIGTGSPSHITQAGADALRAADALLIPDKGPQKSGLLEARYELLERLFPAGQERPKQLVYKVPRRSEVGGYLNGVGVWHQAIADAWSKALKQAGGRPCVALMVWGDPSLYDSSLRIAELLQPKPKVRVIPGITALQALTAAHAIPLNTVGSAFQVTTGRRLREEGWPNGVDTVAVLLDSECSFRSLGPGDFDLWWGAYLGGPHQLLRSGPVQEVADEIVALRAKARSEHGWVMDTYLLRRRAPSPRQS